MSSFVHLSPLLLLGICLAPYRADGVPASRNLAPLSPTPTLTEASDTWLDHVHGSSGGTLALVGSTLDPAPAVHLGQATARLTAELDHNSLSTSLAWSEGGMHVITFAGRFELLDHYRAIDALTLSVGKMFMPIGVDFEEYDAAARPMVSEPLVLLGTHDCWNGIGGQLALATSGFEARLFGAEGFTAGAHHLDGDAHAARDVGLGAWMRAHLGHHFVLGASGAVQVDREVHAKAGLVEADLAFETHDFELKAEGIAFFEHHDLRVGGFLQATQALGIFEVAARADIFEAHHHLERRFALCAGVHLDAAHLLLRAEVSSDFGATGEAAMLQAVASL